MSKSTVLTRVEYRLLTIMMNEAEPLHALCSDTMRDVPGASLDSILKALVKLWDMGLITCRYVSARGHRTPRERLTLAELQRHCSGKSEEQLTRYPDGAEYEFEPTEDGRAEEAKSIYAKYHVEDD